MKRSVLLVVLAFAFSAAVSPQSRSYPQSRDVDLAECEHGSSCFFRGSLNYYDEGDTFSFRMRKNQKVAISLGWGALPRKVKDWQGTVDRYHNGFTILTPTGTTV